LLRRVLSSRKAGLPPRKLPAGSLRTSEIALIPTAQGQPRWVVKLDKFGFAVSSVSACSSGKAAASHVLAAMGYAPSDAGRVLRFSSGWETTAADWEALAEAARSGYQGSPTSRCRQ
jgi:cysteine desulfurase